MSCYVTRHTLFINWIKIAYPQTSFHIQQQMLEIYRIYKHIIFVILLLHVSIDNPCSRQPEENKSLHNFH
jgi:hypothetical protein